MNKKLLVLPMIALFLVGCSTNNNTDNSKKDDSTSDSQHDDLEEEKYIDIHYYRDDNNYTNWVLWLWDYPNGSGAEYTFNSTDSYGAVAHYSITKTWPKATKLGLLVKSKGSWDSKDGVNNDRTIDLSEDLFVNNSRSVYLISGVSTIYADEATATSNKARLLSTDFTSATTISAEATANIVSYQVLENKVVIKEETLQNPSKTINITLDKEASLEKNYELKVVLEGGKETTRSISVASLYKTEDFNNKYNYDGELGAIYTNSKTTFKVWSPVSSEIILRTYETPSHTLGDDNHKDYVMTKGEKGVFSYELSGDQHGLYYTYVVTNSRNNKVEIVDPYAKSTGYNGERGMVVDFSRLNPEGWDEIEVHDYDRKELTIYETHVADVSSSSTWGGTKASAKKFKGMYETGTTYKENDVTVKTGFDHIKELGVNAVQLLPIFDQKNDEAGNKFNWGYNPQNYNALEGAYASDFGQTGIEKIKEFKQLVKAYNQAGINIIMDVVYNHVNSSDDSNFNVLMPNYYFRYTPAGANSGGSGCGNETASEMPMMRKFMIDSTEFWAKEYKLGGFRFDLMGCHDIETMNQIAANLKAKTFENIYICGEPWTGGESELKDGGIPANQDNMSKYVGYGAFNDKMRDGLIKGGLSDATDLGFVTDAKNKVSYDDINAITSGLQGTVAATKTIKDPDKVTNYVTCHDNYTLYDRIVATGKNYDEATIKKMATLANSMVFSSQGTSFMLAGEEFLRTKGGDHNSHASSYKVNELNYALKVKNIDTFQNYQKLIALKQEFAGLHYAKDKCDSYEINVDDNAVISYSITEGGRTYQFIHVNGLGSDKTFNLEGYTLYLDTLGEKTLTASTSLSPFETIIAYK